MFHKLVTTKTLEGTLIILNCQTEKFSLLVNTVSFDFLILDDDRKIRKYIERDMGTTISDFLRITEPFDDFEEFAFFWLDA